MVKQEERRRTAEFLLHSRTISAEHLPIGHSFIPYDLLLQIYLHAISEMREQLNIKSLFASLPYSDMGMRYHLRRLIDNGWIKIDTNGSDPRMRSVTPTAKTFVKFDAITIELMSKIHPT
jgi:hypothetical protein